jgi:Methyltransferase domain
MARLRQSGAEPRALAHPTTPRRLAAPTVSGCLRFPTSTSPASASSATTASPPTSATRPASKQTCAANPSPSSTAGHPGTPTSPLVPRPSPPNSATTPTTTPRRSTGPTATVAGTATTTSTPETPTNSSNYVQYPQREHRLSIFSTLIRRRRTPSNSLDHGNRRLVRLPRTEFWSLGWPGSGTHWSGRACTGPFRKRRRGGVPAVAQPMHLGTTTDLGFATLGHATASSRTDQPVVQQAVSSPPPRSVEPDECASFRYADPDDVLAAAFVSAATSDASAWERNDYELLQQIRTRTDRAVAVDFGSGAGRLLPIMASGWTDVVAYDPDAMRLSRARELCDRLRLRNVRFASTPDEIRTRIGNRSAFVLCSHVLQHVQIRRRPELVRRLSALAGADGRILVLFSGRDGATRYYISGTRRSHPHQAIAVSADRFNRLILDGNVGLPAAHIDASEIIRLLASTRRRVLVAKPYRTFTFQLRTGQSVRCVPGYDWCIEAE